MQHTQVTHGKDLLYQCKQCNVSFTGMEQMRDHAKKFHSYNKTKEEERQKKKGNKF
jgi:predicted RNA-binding protein with PUA domain